MTDFIRPTMCAHGDKATSHIDLFITSDPSIFTESTAMVLPKVPWNTSCHVPVHMDLLAGSSLPEAPKKQKSQAKPYPLIKWDTLNHAEYDRMLNIKLSQFRLDLIDPGAACDLLANCMHLAATLSAESKKLPASGKLRKQRFTRDVLEAVKRARRIHWLWMDAGRPHKDHPLSVERRKASRTSRAAQRRQLKDKRMKEVDEIMSASPCNQAIFHKRVKAHLRGSNLPKVIKAGDKLITDAQEGADAWAEYYEDLATPKDKKEWNSSFLQRAESEIQTIRVFLQHEELERIIITPEMVSRAIGSLNKGKAADHLGVRAEHLLAARETVSRHAAPVISSIVNTEIPRGLKVGRKISVPKKNKNDLIMGNHRGITITPTIGKLVEHVTVKEAPLPEQSDLQFGFTEGLSPVMASLCLTEVACEAHNEGEELVLTGLDVQKAFDTVNHVIMLQTLHQNGLPLQWWRLVDSLYTDAVEYVEWEGCKSHEYTVRQGVRQGGVMSTHLFKIQSNRLLELLKNSGLGCQVRGIYLGCPTCADDMMLCANRGWHMQGMTTITECFSSTRRYTINPDKSELTSKTGIKHDITLNGEKIQQQKAVNHLGLQRQLKSNDDIIQQKIGLGRATLYSLIPSGLHGESGLSPPVSRKLMLLYVLPRMLYGLEALILTETQLKTLDRAWLKLLRDSMSLRENTASEAIYLLIGMLPFRIEYHTRVLQLYGSITRLDEQHALRKLAFRQLSMGNGKNRSWFRYVKGIAVGYGIGESVLAAVNVPWGKNDWKMFISKSIRHSYFHELVKGARERSSLEYMDPTVLKPGTAHDLWPRGASAGKSRVAASIRAKMLAGSYILQSNRAKFNQFEVSPECNLCKEGVEDLPHMILLCKSLAPKREPILTKILKLLKIEEKSAKYTPGQLCLAVLNAGTLTRSVYDPVYMYKCACSACVACGGAGHDPCSDCDADRTPVHGRSVCVNSYEYRTNINFYVNTLCLVLHNRRCALLDREAPRGCPKKSKKTSKSSPAGGFNQ